MKKRLHSLYTIGQKAVIAFGVIALLFSLYNTILLLQLPSSSKNKEYTEFAYRIAFISDTSQNPVFAEIFNFCKSLEKKYNCAIDLLLPETDSLPLQTLIDRANAEEADGIVLYCAKEASEVSTIVNAKGNTIPLLVISNSKTKNTAVSHIGLNGYESGKQIANILGAVLKNGETVMALKSSEQTNNIFNLVYYSMNEYLEKNSITVVPENIQKKENISSEDIIRDKLRFQSNINAILCFSESDTIRVAENIIDLNLSGKIFVIGFGETERLQSYLRKNIISACVSYEAEKIGETALSSIIEYIKTANTNEYITLPLKTIYKDFE